MTENALADECRNRLTSIIGAVGTLHAGRDINRIRAKVTATPQIGIPVISVEILRHPPASSGYQNTCYWGRAGQDIQSDIEMAFFSGTFSRPSLKRQGLFKDSRSAIEANEVQPSVLSSHARIQAIATLKAIGAYLPY